MATANGTLSDDDELFVNGSAAEPRPFTFQSYLGSDDEADPLTLDELTKVSLAALQNGTQNGTLGSPPNDDDVVMPAIEDEQAEDRQSEDMQAEDRQTNGIAEIPAKEPPKESTKEPTKSTRPVGIEVHLPWIPPAQRAQYQKVRVEDYRPEDGHRTRRRRRRVSHIIAWCLSVVFWLLDYGGRLGLMREAQAHSGLWLDFRGSEAWHRIHEVSRRILVVALGWASSCCCPGQRVGFQGKPVHVLMYRCRPWSQSRTSLDTPESRELMEVKVWRSWPGRFLPPLRAIPKLAFHSAPLFPGSCLFPSPALLSPSFRNQPAGYKTNNFSLQQYFSPHQPTTTLFFQHHFTHSQSTPSSIHNTRLIARAYTVAPCCPWVTILPITLSIFTLLSRFPFHSDHIRQVGGRDQAKRAEERDANSRNGKKLEAGKATGCTPSSTLPINLQLTANSSGVCGGTEFCDQVSSAGFTAWSSLTVELLIGLAHTNFLAFIQANTIVCARVLVLTYPPGRRL